MHAYANSTNGINQYDLLRFLSRNSKFQTNKCSHHFHTFRFFFGKFPKKICLRNKLFHYYKGNHLVYTRKKYLFTKWMEMKCSFNGKSTDMRVFRMVLLAVPFILLFAWRKRINNFVHTNLFMLFICYSRRCCCRHRHLLANTWTINYSL